nr:unnamed protein product [Spirometra erinaceieuropaei]
MEDRGTELGPPKSYFFAAFDFLVDFRRSRLHDKTTNPTVRGISSPDLSRQFAVPDPEPNNPCRHLIGKYPGLIHSNVNLSTPPHNVVHHIRITSPPVFSLFCRLPPARLVPAKADFEHILRMGIICQVLKAATGNWRPHGDYKASSNVSTPDHCTIPNLQYFAGTIFGKSVVPKIYLVLAFYQIPIASEDLSKTALSTPFDLFALLYLPFGLRNAYKAFHVFVDGVCRGLPFIYVLIDDLLVDRSTAKEHTEHIATMTKAALGDATLLTHSAPDAPVSIRVDVFNVTAGAVLQQHLSRHTQPFVFLLWKVITCRTRFSTFGRWILAVFLAVEHFRHFLEGGGSTVFSDNELLSFALKSTSDKHKPREIGQVDYISQFTSDIRHIDGSYNGVADAPPGPPSQISNFLRRKTSPK